MKAIEFNGEKIFIHLNKGRLEALDKEGFPYMVISLKHESIGDGEFLIKDYSENEGILDALISNKIVAKPHRYIKQGFVNAPVCKLLY